MVKKFDNIDRTNGVIRGESDDYGVISVPDEDWDEIEDFEGNWEEITETIISTVYEKNISDSREELQLDYDTVVEILRDKGIVSYDIDDDNEDSIDDETIEKQETRKAELLLEFLIDQDIYQIEGGDIGIVQTLKPSANEFVKFNWSAFLTVTAERLDKVVKQSKKMKENIADYYDNIGANKIDPKNTKKQLLQDLNSITGAKTKEDAMPKKVEENRIVPPDSVHERDKYEYKKKIRRLDALKVTENHQQHELEIDPIKQLGVYIDELETYSNKFHNLEKDMRKKSIPQIVDLHGVQEDMQNAIAIANNFGVMGERSTNDVESLGDSIGELASEVGFEFGGADEDVTETDRVPEGTETETATEDTVTEGANPEAETQDRSNDDGKTQPKGGSFGSLADNLTDHGD